jgi:predicted 3-demethylubiquinone-9 3-methyltransferase (glyoxalase superfamily)
VNARVQPFLMFQGNAAEAMRFYVSLFPDGAIIAKERYRPGETGAEGSSKRASFCPGSQIFICIDSTVRRDFTFAAAVYLFIDCSSTDELQRLFTALSDGATVFMPLADYGSSRCYGWVGDRFGVAWQINLP